MNTLWKVIALTMVIGSPAAFAQQASKATMEVAVMNLAKEDAQRFETCVEIKVPLSLVNNVRVLTPSGLGYQIEGLPYNNRITGTNGTHNRIVRRTKDGAAEQFFHVYVKKGLGTKFVVIRNGGKRYPVLLDQLEVGPVAVKDPSEYGPLAGLYSAQSTQWSLATKRRVLESTVRVLTPSGVGTGTMVDTPPWLEHLVPEGWVLVLTAAHVVPLHLRSDAAAVETFTFDSSLNPKVDKRFQAYVLSTDDHAMNPDVGYMIFQPLEYRVVRVPTAKGRRWFSRKYQYLTVGCPKGKLPRFSFTKAVSAERPTTGGKVSMDHKSEKGESGGPLFDPDGVLIGIRSGTSDDANQMIVGTGILGVQEEGSGSERLFTSVFYHPSSTQGSVSENITAQALRDFEAAIRVLAPEDRVALKAQYSQMLKRAPGLAKTEGE